jgi:RNA pseudouridylate synthase
MMPETIEGRVLYRDGLMIVLNKPAGMAVHRGPKGGASLEAEFDALRFGLPHPPPALAHRLDRETSGCLICVFSLISLMKFPASGRTHTCAESKPQGAPLEEVKSSPRSLEGRVDRPISAPGRGCMTQGVGK